MLSFAARVNYLKYPDGLYRGHVLIDRGQDGYRTNVGPTATEMEMVVRLEHAVREAISQEFMQRFQEVVAAPPSGPVESQKVA
jgi:hypothetical protein